MTEEQTLMPEDLTESSLDGDTILYSGPGFKHNWEQAPIKLTNLLIRPYYFDPKHLSERGRRLALALLASQGIIPQTDIVALQDMKSSRNPIKKGQIVWAVGEKYDENDKAIPFTQRMKQISKLKAFWKAGEKDLSLPLGFYLPNPEDIMFTPEERKKATQELKYFLPTIHRYDDKEKWLAHVRELIQEGADVNVFYDSKDTIVSFPSSRSREPIVYEHPNNSFILTLAQLAAAHGDRDFMELLDKKGIDWNKKDLRLGTPITSAFIFGNEEAIQFLLKKKVSFTHKNKFGKAPLDYYTPKLIHNTKLIAQLDRMKQEMKEQDAAKKYGPDYWEDVTFRKGNKKIHGHRISTEKMSDEEKNELRDLLSELEIPFKEGPSDFQTDKIALGEPVLRVSKVEGIRKLHTFWGWQAGKSKRIHLPIEEEFAPITGPNPSPAKKTETSVRTQLADAETERPDIPQIIRLKTKKTK